MSRTRSTARESGELTARGTTRVPATLISVTVTTTSPTAKPTHAPTIRAFKRFGSSPGEVYELFAYFVQDLFVILKVYVVQELFVVQQTQIEGVLIVGVDHILLPVARSKVDLVRLVQVYPHLNPKDAVFDAVTECAWVLDTAVRGADVNVIRHRSILPRQLHSHALLAPRLLPKGLY
jgi:hypothetical protein